MCTDRLAVNTPNAPKLICPNCLPKPKSLGFLEKKANIQTFVNMMIGILSLVRSA